MNDSLFTPEEIPVSAVERDKRYWIGVVSRQHVLRGVSEGFAQVCHGKPGPLRRMRREDRLIYYSPTEVMGEKSSCKRFTALGTVAGDEVYPFDMGGGFVPYRRDINYMTVREAPILPLLGELAFITDKRNWGYPFRRGCFEISLSDFAKIASAMGPAEK